MLEYGYDKQKILEILEMSEKEFDKEVVNKIKMDIGMDTEIRNIDQCKI